MSKHFDFSPWELTPNWDVLLPGDTFKLIGDDLSQGEPGFIFWLPLHFNVVYTVIARGLHVKDDNYLFEEMKEHYMFLSSMGIVECML